MEESSSQKSYDPIGERLGSVRPVRKSRWLVLALFLFIVIFGGIIAGKSYLRGSDEKKDKIISIPTPTENEIEFIVETPVASDSRETPTLKATPTLTPKPAIDPVDKETGLDRSELSIEILNGSGVTGAASKASGTLKGFGYRISSIGNADNTDYENVTIKVKSDKNKFLDLLKKDLGFSYTVGSTSADLADDASSDAVVIVGK